MVTPEQAEHLRAMPQGEIPCPRPPQAQHQALQEEVDVTLSCTPQPSILHAPTQTRISQGGTKGSRNFPEPRALPAPNLQPNFQTQTSRSRALHDVKWCCLKHKNKAGCRSSFSYLSQDTQGSTPTARASPAPSLGQFEAHPALLKGEQLQRTPPCLHLS